ncbi:hypothetical protein PF005_g24611 [Phytophthora fragariae]|uniref:Aminotransferase class I/classII large domain-containing protein n=1 Tax=Phytophthora fragariae TaxID=53985 RepID=A0A6A3W1N7_9STRA|nr:hypothetical protein PF005_g24611 [Phytophthora fragariae]
MMQMRIVITDKRAARRFVDSSALAVAYKLAEDACAAIKGKEVDFAVPPIESSTFANYDLLSKYSLHIVNEYDLLQQEQEASPVQDASSYTRSLPLFKTELGLDDKKTAAIDFKTSLVFGSKDSTQQGEKANDTRSYKYYVKVSAAESTRQTGCLETGTSITMADKYPSNPMFQKVAPTARPEAEGTQVWSFCVGEPDYDPHEHIQAASTKAMSEGSNLEKAKRVKCDEATEKVIDHPDALPAQLPGDRQARTLEKTMTAHPDTKATILCNPSNPAGTLHNPEHQELIAAVMRKPYFHRVVVVSDEVFEQLLY